MKHEVWCDVRLHVATVIESEKESVLEMTQEELQQAIIEVLSLDIGDIQVMAVYRTGP